MRHLVCASVSAQAAKSIIIEALNPSSNSHAISAWLHCELGHGATQHKARYCLQRKHETEFTEIDMSNPANRNMFRSAFDAMVAARSRQAQSYANGALLMLDDETLKAHGLSRSELKKNARPYPIY
jgi:hypothetical protein